MIPDPGLIELVASLIVIPWVIWITSSIFNQRQEIALMRQSHDDLKGMLQVIINSFKEDRIKYP